MKQFLQKYDKRDNFYSVNFPLVGDVTRRPSNDVYASLNICFDIGSSNVIDFNGRKIQGVALRMEIPGLSINTTENLKQKKITS